MCATTVTVHYYMNAYLNKKQLTGITSIIKSLSTGNE